VLAQFTAFDLLTGLLVLGLISALCGYAGGTGARLLFAVRVDRVEGLLLQLLNRAKGAAGGVVAQVQKARLTSAEKEAEQLAAKLSALPKRGLFGRAPRGSADAGEEQSLREIERAQDAARKAAGS